MQRIAAMRVLWVAMAIVLLSAASASGSTRNLYPRCATTEVAGQASGGQTITLKALSENPAELIVACLAVDVAPLGPEADNACTVVHQTDYAYRLFLSASYTDPNTNQLRTVEYDLKEVMGGSANRIHVRLPANGAYALKFTNLASSQQCSLKARAMLETEAGDSAATSSKPAPVLVAVRPTVLFTESTQYAYFVFRHVVSALGSDADVVQLIENNRQCSDLHNGDAALTLTPVRQADTDFPSATEGLADVGTVSVKKHYFDRVGTFRMCYQQIATTSGAWQETAMVSVYSGNPSYYTFESGQGPKGQIYVGHQIKIRFHGYGLDTRPGGDQAKFVDGLATCDGGAPAGGVAVATDLGPADDWGPNTKFTEWTWTLKVAGPYKICYKRRDHGWVEVPSLDEIGPGAIEHTSPPQGPIPTPTDPISKTDCPMAPTGADNTHPYTPILKATLTVPTIPASYLSTLSQVLCLPQSALSIVRESKTEGTVVLWIDVQCTVSGAHDRLPCNAQERKNYALFLATSNSPMLSTLKWASVEQTSQDDLFAQQDGFSGFLASKHSRFAFLIGCVTLIVVVGLAVWGVLKYKQNQHYFIQFGVEDDDVEADGVDDLEIDEYGTIGTKQKKKDAPPPPHVPNATIDMELDDAE